MSKHYILNPWFQINKNSELPIFDLTLVQIIISVYVQLTGHNNGGCTTPDKLGDVGRPPVGCWRSNIVDCSNKTFTSFDNTTLLVHSGV